MKNLNTAVVLGLLAASMSGCVAMKTKILDAGAVSMTHTSLKEGEKLQEKGTVTGQFCADSRNDQGNIGLMDEAIKSAQKQNNVDFITNAVFYKSGNCISVEGTGGKIVASNAAAAPAAPSAVETKRLSPKRKK